ncbi:PRC-barrel domain-containing protein [Halorientalis marina]|jgi:sporulation protein YlmC with PRC-barrel domain|uniref:PRC-barrel domain-containing protein n=1 Tax=Halorientalis marina TaxID=2931976 RepID=UPI001FF45D83|nr:PRC-barrel domain-containing protein [Halorientalis marina]
MDAPTQEITALVGREVYSNNGVFVGEVEDVRLDLDGVQVTGIAVHRANKELFGDRTAGKNGVIVPYDWVQAVGDVVLVSDVIERIKPVHEEDEAEVAV